MMGCLEHLEQAAAWRKVWDDLQQQYSASILKVAIPGDRLQCSTMEIRAFVGDLLPDELVLQLLEREVVLTKARWHDLRCQMRKLKAASRIHPYQAARVSLEEWLHVGDGASSKSMFGLSSKASN